MNITLSIDEEVAERARKTAQSRGKSLNQVIRDYLAELAGQADVTQELAELRRLTFEGRGRSRGKKIVRDALHERA